MDILPYRAGEGRRTLWFNVVDHKAFCMILDLYHLCVLGVQGTL